MFNDKAEAMAKIIHKSRIKYTEYNRAYEEIVNLHTRAANGLGRQGLTVRAPSGGGKSTLVEAIQEKFPAIDRGDFLEQSVIVTSIPPEPTGLSMGKAILDAMGAYYSVNAKTADIDKALVSQFRECKTLVLLIDESQELVERGTKNQHKKLADWFKWLMNATDVSIVFLGLPKLTNLYQANSQLRRRFSECCDLNGWHLNDADQMREFQGVIHALIVESGYQGDQKIVLDAEFIEQFHYATNGIIAYVVKLLAEAIRLAECGKHKVLKTGIFEEAFKRKICPDIADDRNPFAKKFKKRPLTEFNEPFAEEC